MANVRAKMMSRLMNIMTMILEHSDGGILAKHRFLCRNEMKNTYCLHA